MGGKQTNATQECFGEGKNFRHLWGHRIFPPFPFCVLSNGK